VTTTVITPATATVPWKLPTELQDKQGVNIAVMGYPGSGKTEFGASGPKPLVVDIDGTAVRTLGGRTDVQIAPIKNWDDIDRLSTYLLSRPHPFQTIWWDSLTFAQTYALKKIMVGSAPGVMPSQGQYGNANELVLDLVRTWCAQARERGVHVGFAVHAEEIKDESTGQVLIRMALTPGCIKGVNMATDTIGYLAVAPNSDNRKMLLRSTGRVLAKHHQPKDSPKKLPPELDSPTFSMFIDQTKTVTK